MCVYACYCIPCWLYSSLYDVDASTPVLLLTQLLLLNVVTVVVLFLSQLQMLCVVMMVMAGVVLHVVTVIRLCNCGAMLCRYDGYCYQLRRWCCCSILSIALLILCCWLCRGCGECCL